MAAEAATAAKSADESAASDFVTTDVPVAMDAATISRDGQFGFSATSATKHIFYLLRIYYSCLKNLFVVINYEFNDFYLF